MIHVLDNDERIERTRSQEYARVPAGTGEEHHDDSDDEDYEEWLFL
jgi:hypothetical protein